MEGNFAFASAIQEMLIQSHTGIVQIFPAVPKTWKDISFDQLRTEGAFLVSAKKEKGVIVTVEIKSEKGGVLKMKNPFGENDFKCNLEYKLNEDVLIISTKIGQEIKFNILNQ